MSVSSQILSVVSGKKPDISGEMSDVKFLRRKCGFGSEEIRISFEGNSNFFRSCFSSVSSVRDKKILIWTEGFLTYFFLYGKFHQVTFASVLTENEEMKKLFFFVLLLVPMCRLFAQDEHADWSLTLPEAEAYFVRHNLNVLAEHYSVDQADAAVLQAKLFENPTVSFEQNVYNRNNRRYFDFGPEGESAVEVEQLIYLAGQRNKRVKLEKINREMAELQFEEVVRTLRQELKQKFVDLYFTLKSSAVYDTEIQALSDLLEVYRSQQEKGNISAWERTRLDALLLSLRQEQFEVEKQVAGLQGDLRLLLGIKNDMSFRPILDESVLEKIGADMPSLSDLLSRQRERPDLKLASALVRASQADVALQRSLAFPDFSLKGSYDKAGNFIQDYWAVGFSVSLPLFNRNQGNIKAAKIRVKQQAYREEYANRQAENELLVGYARLQKAIALYRESGAFLEQDFARLVEGAGRSFRQRNIGLLEFVDYYETYKNTCQDQNRLKREIFQAVEDMNSLVGWNVFVY